MANVVLNIGPLTQQATSNQALELYRDIDINAAPNYNHKNMAEVKLSDYVEWLVLNNNMTTIANNTYELSHVLEDYQVINDDNEDQVLSAIALTIRSNYDEQKSLYYKYTDPYRWRIAKLINVKAVQNSIHNIFTWIPGERIINPEFGSNLRLHLYEGITEANVEAIMAEIRNSVSKWEPRANITKVVDASTIDETEDNTVHLLIYYTIPSLTDEQYEYSYYYKRSDD